MNDEQLRRMYIHIAETCVDLYKSGDEEMMDHYKEVVIHFTNQVKEVLNKKYENVVNELNKNDDD